MILIFLTGDRSGNKLFKLFTKTTTTNQTSNDRSANTFMGYELSLQAC